MHLCTYIYMIGDRWAFELGFGGRGPLYPAQFIAQEEVEIPDSMDTKTELNIKTFRTTFDVEDNEEVRFSTLY
jgi:hypothetical protein